MKVDIVTIFPAMVRSALAEGIVARAAARGVLDIEVHDLREHTTDRHRVVDDMPFGGGPGMVLKPEPLFKAVAAIRAERGQPGAVILTTPDGPRFDHGHARRLSGLGHLVVLCGRYEGVDARVRDHLVDGELSVGDYVLAGGEVAALVVVEAVGRLVPGVMGNTQSADDESFAAGLLEYPHYTRPADFRGWEVPEILRSGDHGKVAEWRLVQSLVRTIERRPDLVAARGGLTEAEVRLLERHGYAGPLPSAAPPAPPTPRRSSQEHSAP